MPEWSTLGKTRIYPNFASYSDSFNQRTFWFNLLIFISNICPRRSLTAINHTNININLSIHLIFFIYSCKVYLYRLHARRIRWSYGGHTSTSQQIHWIQLKYLFVPFARVGSGDPVRVLRLLHNKYTGYNWRFICTVCTCRIRWSC